MHRKPIGILVAAAAAASAVVAAGPAVADDSAAAQDRYVTSLVVKARDASAYTQVGDYVRVLEYWHDHPDWGLGS
jgi:hypothetical protein